MVEFHLIEIDPTRTFITGLMPLRKYPGMSGPPKFFRHGLRWYRLPDRIRSEYIKIIIK